MTISLENVLPIPLADKPAVSNSEIWNRQIVFNQSEWIKIKAPSGTGKTTFIHILYHLRQDYKGKVLADGNAVVDFSSQELSTLRQQALSIVFQDMKLFPQLTAKENIQLNRVLPSSTYYGEEVIEEMAERLGITHILNQKAGICSYGEQQRIAIIRALVQPFNWLLLDEPFSHLDKKNAAAAAQLISSECTKRSAGFILLDLEDDTYFSYHRQLQL
ncbi:MAG: ATP-binding cassette protein [Chitinophagaceae bacterium]|nr:ATP-binding cassette protein [Chitinophagaceae bacterium]